jgi:hypothetical protein
MSPETYPAKTVEDSMLALRSLLAGQRVPMQQVR